jgi:hypothetical protein
LTGAQNYPLHVDLQANQDTQEKVRRSLGGPFLLAAVGLFIVAVVLGYLGWILPTPGGSVFLPTLLVFAIALVIAAVSWLVAALRARPGLQPFAIGTAVVGVIAAGWTFQFSLPASMAWNSGATVQAKTVLAHLDALAQGHRGVAPLQPCVTHITGSVGPLDAPYRTCGIWTPEGHFVTFTVGTPANARGLGYTNAGSATFPDECERHLVGDWWMFTNSNDPGDPGMCPIGYHFQGGP